MSITFTSQRSFGRLSPARLSYSALACVVTSLLGWGAVARGTELKYSMITSLSLTFPDALFANPPSTLSGRADAQFSGQAHSSAFNGESIKGLPHGDFIGTTAFDLRGPSKVSIGMQLVADGNTMTTGGSASADLFSPNALRGFGTSYLTAAAGYANVGGETLPFAFGILPTETMPTFAAGQPYFANFTFDATSDIPNYEQLFHITVTSHGGALSAVATSNPLLGLSTDAIIAAALAMFHVGVDADGNPAFIATGGANLLSFTVPVPAGDTNAQFNLTLRHTLNVPEPTNLFSLMMGGSFLSAFGMRTRRRTDP